MKFGHAWLALVALSPFAGATTWIVDVNNGPGADFTQISTAIASVSANDTLLVRPGQYSGFTLDKQLAIVGLGTVTFPNATIQNLPAGTTTVLANLVQNDVSGFGKLSVVGNAGALMIDQLTCHWTVLVTNSADVRFRRLDAQHTVLCGNSRVEIADSTIVGSQSGGSCTCCFNPAVGMPALSVLGGEVHVALTSLLGGHGGNNTCIDTGNCDGGDGGAGIELTSGARLIVSGTSQDFVQGGAGGTSSCDHPGSSGPALSLDASSEARLSGESFVGWISNNGGTIINPSPDDPTFVALGSPSSGNVFTLRVHGPVGATADVILGRRPIIVGTPALDEEQLTPVNRVFHLGVIPANGTASLNFPVSPSWPQGFSVVFQGRLTAGASTVYTNSLPAIVQ